MKRSHWWYSAPPLAALLLATPAALAAADATSGAPVLTIDQQGRTLDEHTALTLGARRFKLGVLSFDYGITDRVTIGTDPPAWAARAVLPMLVPNFHVKVVAIQTDKLWLTGR